MVDRDGALYRELARRIAREIGDGLGNREAVILADPDVRVRRSGDYRGCWIVSNAAGSFVYRQADRKIVN